MEHNTHQKTSLPKDGLAGLTENFSSDALSGFLVFLLALPLSMGIAQASDFQPIYGLITAMIGGLVVAFFAGSLLTIKGPAAGLIVIVAGAVAEFGGGELGWHLALGAVVVAGVLQILFGVLKLGGLADFFPLSAVHGMLAAIGIIIISKQIHGLLGQNPLTEDGHPMVEPLELLAAIPHTLSHPNLLAMIVGIVSLVIVFGWPMIDQKWVKKIPAPVIVLFVAIPLSFAVGLDKKYFVHFDKGLLDILAVNVSFDGFSQTGAFIKYVIMFALVGTLEALLTVKAIDLLDPYKRKSNANKDLIAVGLGNVVAGVLGGLPMISEVARSSSNVNNGGKTRWANFFHGLFILIFLLLAVQFSDLIPKPALSAMLIGVGFKLAHPSEFKHMLHIGKEQLIIFCVTIVATLATDLLVGIAAGIITKIILYKVNGVSFSDIFKSKITHDRNFDRIKVTGGATFLNFIKLKNILLKNNLNEIVKIDFSECNLVDHTTLDNLKAISKDFYHNGGNLVLDGLEELTTDSDHPNATRIRKQ